MREAMRLLATLIIWSLFATVMIFTITSATGPIANADGGQITGIIAVLATAATVSTFALWYGFNRSDDRSDEAAHSARGKIKRARGDRIERLILSLDDDEIYDLEALLLAREDDPARRRES